MYLFENSKVYLKKTLKTYAFMFKFENIQKVDFQYCCISFQTQKYTWSRLLISALEIHLGSQFYQGFFWAKQCFHSNHLGKNIAKVIIS